MSAETCVAEKRQDAAEGFPPLGSVCLCEKTKKKERGEQMELQSVDVATEQNSKKGQCLWLTKISAETEFGGLRISIFRGTNELFIFIITSIEPLW